MNKLLFLPVCALAAATISWAADIRGLIVDSAGEPLPGASVQLVAMPDTIRAGYMLAGDSGEFNFSNVKVGRYYLFASMVSMEDGIREVNVNDSTKNINLGRIALGDDAIMLEEAVVTAIKSSVVAKQDTLEFNAGSFHTAPNATVNDLLKRLPGVEVGNDGSITSNGKTISKILVDGKEFFSDDPQMATKNLPSNIVDKVQVVDRKSDLARLTGVDDGEEETVINLTVKKEMNNGWFGSIKGGYGTDGRYEGNFTVNHFFNGNQLTFVGGLNNVNDMSFIDAGRGFFRFGDGSRNGITNSQGLGINFNIGNEEIFRVGGNVRYSHTDRKSTSHTYTQYLFPDSISTQDANSNMRDRGHNINADFRLQWKPDANNTFEFRPRVSVSFRDTESSGNSLLQAGDAARSNVNKTVNSQVGKGTSVTASGELIYNHNFSWKPGRSLSVRAGYDFSNSTQHSSSWNNIIYYLLHDNDDELYRYIDNHTWSNAVDGRLTWTEPLGDPTRGNFLNFAYRIQYKWNNADKFTYNLDNPADAENFIPPFMSEAPAGSVMDPTLSNSFRNSFFTQELQVGYKKVSKTFNLDAGLLFSPSSSKSIDLIDNARNIPTRWVWNVSPYANMRLKFANGASVRANYRARTSQPSMTQLQPVADVSDPLNVIIGNPELKPTFTQSIMAHFMKYNSANQQALMFMANASYALNTVVARTVSDPETGGRTTTYGNVNGNFNIFGMAMINQPFSNRKWRFNGMLNARFASTPGYINGDFNRTESFTLSPRAGVTFTNDLLQASVSPQYSLNSITNTLPDQRGRLTHSYGFMADFSLYLPFGLELNTDLDFSKTTGYSQGFNSAQWLWNAELSYSFLSDKSLTVYARAYDLLGMKKNISRSVSSSSIVDSEYNDLTRYFMFGLSWNFNSMSKQSSNQGMGDFEDVPPPPDGEGGGPGGGPGGPGGGPGGATRGGGPGGFGGRPLF